MEQQEEISTTTSPQQNDSDLLDGRKQQLKMLGKCECVLSVICIILGDIAWLYTNSIPNLFGEGIWFSILPFFAGILAFAVGPRADKYTLPAHVVVAIFSTISMIALFSLEIFYVVKAPDPAPGATTLLAIITIIAFTNSIVLIVSASCTCTVLPGCTCCCEQLPLIGLNISPPVTHPPTYANGDNQQNIGQHTTPGDDAT